MSSKPSYAKLKPIAIDSFMLSFNKHFLSTYCMPSIILGMEDTVITQKKVFILLELLIMVRIRQQTKYNHVFGLSLLLMA